MKNWTIAKRIIAGGTLLIALLLVVGGSGISALFRIESFTKSRLRDDAIPGIVYIADISTQTFRAHTAALMANEVTDPARRRQYIEEISENATTAATAMKNYESTISSSEDQNNFETLKEYRERYLTLRSSYLDLVKSGQNDAARTFGTEKLESAFVAFRDQTMLMVKWNQTVAIKATGEIIATADRATTTTAIVAAASLLLAAGAGWFIIRGITGTLMQMTRVLDDSANQVAAAAGQVSSSSQSLAEGSSEQAASLEETSSSLEELASMTKRNADSAGTAKGLSGETRQAAETGNNDMTEMRQAMEAIKKSSNDIAKIIKTIDEIAFQTNILALNAAVEAARAGEAGAGFAVVAEEVRALAQRSANSAKETAEKIEIAIHNGDQGVQISQKVAHSLGLIVEKARKVDELVAEIATASGEQNQGIGQINTAVGQMDKVTQSNAANAEETAAAAEQLNAQSASLKDAVGDLRRLVSQAAEDSARASQHSSSSGQKNSGRAAHASPFTPDRPATPSSAASRADQPAT